MGLAASQARLLSLTSKMSELEYKAQALSDDKMSLSNSASQASEDYNAALSRKKITAWNGESTTNGKTYITATANNLTNFASGTGAQRLLKDSYGKVMLSQAGKETVETADFIFGKFKTLTDTTGTTTPTNSADDFSTANINSMLASLCGTDATYGNNSTLNYCNLTKTQITEIEANAKTAALAKIGSSTEPSSTDTNYNKYVTAYQSYVKEAVLTYGMANGGLIDKSERTDSSCLAYYSNLYNEVSKSGYNVQSDEHMSDQSWLYDQLQNGNMYLSDWNSEAEVDSNGDGHIDGSDTTGDYEKVAWATGDSSINVEDDDTAVTKAETEYQLVEKEIETKENSIDIELQNINTEHSAIQTEIDSLNSIIGKNIDRNFKLFQA